MTAFYLELRPPEVAVEACPEAETVAAVAVGADSAVAGEGTDAKTPSMVNSFCTKIAATHLKPHLPTESPSSENPS